MAGPGGHNENQVSESFFSLIIDEVTGNWMTSLLAKEDQSRRLN